MMVSSLTCTLRMPSIAKSAAASGTFSSAASKLRPLPSCTGASRMKRMTEGSRGDSCARMRLCGRASDNLYLGCVHPPQLIKGVDARLMAIAETDAKRVITDAPDPDRRDVERH